MYVSMYACMFIHKRARETDRGRRWRDWGIESAKEGKNEMGKKGDEMGEKGYEMGKEGHEMRG